jgi:WD40 repeat protein
MAARKRPLQPETGSKRRGPGRLRFTKRRAIRPREIGDAALAQLASGRERTFATGSGSNGAWSGNGSLLATGDGGSDVKVWDTARAKTQDLLKLTGCQGGGCLEWSLAVSANGQRIAVVDSSNDVFLFEPGSSRPLQPSMATAAPPTYDHPC